MTVRVSVDEVSVSYGTTAALREVSLDVSPGELVTLLGPSGSGKTTLLGVLAGFERQQHGHVRLDGELADDVAPQHRGLGVVFQSYALFPHLSVGDNVAFALRARKIGRRERRARAAEALRTVRLDDLADRSVRTLSGGQQQRVALARALVFGPRALLLDEPLAALDAALRRDMQVELKRIQREVGVTTVAVTHDQTEALTMSDRVAVLHEGRLQQAGTPEEVYRRPANRFVAGFVGLANLVPARGGDLSGLGSLAEPADGTAVLRPEDLAIEVAGTPGRAAIVVRADFQGATRRCELRTLDGDERLVAQVDAAGSEQTLQPGTRVSVRARRPDLVHVLAGETSGTGATLAVAEPERPMLAAWEP